MDTQTFDCMVGKIMRSVTGNAAAQEMVFCDEQGVEYVFYHDQDCCETVEIVDVIGELSDLVGDPILQAEEVVSHDQITGHEYSEHGTWTFYKFATIKGSVTVRWLGESNGASSEEVHFKVNAETTRPAVKGTST